VFSVAAKFTSKVFQFLWILSMGNSFLILPVLSDGAAIVTAPEFGLIIIRQFSPDFGLIEWIF